MLRRILIAALVAGAAAGLAVSLVQTFQVLPLIDAAEGLETAASSAPGSAPDSAPGSEVHTPSSRAYYTVLFNILTGVAFGLLLVSAYAISGRPVDWRRGLIWGLAGFAAVGLAPALGMPPSPPGSELAPLAGRQGWWLLCVAFTAGGLAVIFFAKGWHYRLLGAVFLAAPHLIGAPQRDGLYADPGLAFEFAVAFLAATGIFWAVLGGVSGYVYRKLG